MASKEPRVIEILQHRGGGWDIKEPGKSIPVAHCDREVDAESKAREMATASTEVKIIIRGESGRIYHQFTVSRGTKK